MVLEKLCTPCVRLHLKAVLPGSLNPTTKLHYGKSRNHPFVLNEIALNAILMIVILNSHCM